MTVQGSPSGQQISFSMVLLPVSFLSMSFSYSWIPTSIQLETMILEWRLEFLLQLPPLISSPTPLFLVTKFQVKVGWALLQHTTPLSLFQQILFLMISEELPVQMMPFWLLKTSFLITLSRPALMMQIPVPGLSDTMLSMSAEWWEYLPPMAILHYMLWLISFFQIIPLLLYTTRMPSLQFLQILLLLITGKAYFYILTPTSPLKPIIWLLLTTDRLFYPQISTPFSLLPTMLIFFLTSALHMNFLQDLQTMPFYLLFQILLSVIDGKALWIYMPSPFQQMMFLEIQGQLARPTLIPTPFLLMLLEIMLNLNYQPTRWIPTEFYYMKFLMILERLPFTPHTKSPPSLWLLIIEFQMQKAPSLHTMPMVLLTSWPLTSELLRLRVAYFSAQMAGIVVVHDLTRQLKLNRQLLEVNLPLSMKTMMLSIFVGDILLINQFQSCSMFQCCQKILRMCQCQRSSFLRLLAELPECENFMPEKVTQSSAQGSFM